MNLFVRSILLVGCFIVVTWFGCSGDNIQDLRSGSLGCGDGKCEAGIVAQSFNAVVIDPMEKLLVDINQSLKADKSINANEKVVSVTNLEKNSTRVCVAYDPTDGKAHNNADSNFALSLNDVKYSGYNLNNGPLPSKESSEYNGGKFKYNMASNTSSKTGVTAFTDGDGKKVSGVHYYGLSSRAETGVRKTLGRLIYNADETNYRSSGSSNNDLGAAVFGGNLVRSIAVDPAKGFSLKMECKYPKQYKKGASKTPENISYSGCQQDQEFFGRVNLTSAFSVRINNEKTGKVRTKTIYGYGSLQPKADLPPGSTDLSQMNGYVSEGYMYSKFSGTNIVMGPACEFLQGSTRKQIGTNIPLEKNIPDTKEVEPNVDDSSENDENNEDLKVHHKVRGIVEDLLKENQNKVPTLGHKFKELLETYLRENHIIENNEYAEIDSMDFSSVGAKACIAKKTKKISRSLKASDSGDALYNLTIGQDKRKLNLNNFRESTGRINTYHCHYYRMSFPQTGDGSGGSGDDAEESECSCFDRPQGGGCGEAWAHEMEGDTGHCCWAPKRHYGTPIEDSQFRYRSEGDPFSVLGGKFDFNINLDQGTDISAKCAYGPQVQPYRSSEKTFGCEKFNPIFNVISKLTLTVRKVEKDGSSSQRNLDIWAYGSPEFEEKFEPGVVRDMYNYKDPDNISKNFILEHFSTSPVEFSDYCEFKIGSMVTESASSGLEYNEEACYDEYENYNTVTGILGYPSGVFVPSKSAAKSPQCRVEKGKKPNFGCDCQDFECWNQVEKKVNSKVVDCSATIARQFIGLEKYKTAQAIIKLLTDIINGRYMNLIGSGSSLITQLAGKYGDLTKCLDQILRFVQAVKKVIEYSKIDNSSLNIEYIFEMLFVSGDMSGFSVNGLVACIRGIEEIIVNNPDDPLLKELKSLLRDIKKVMHIFSIIKCAYQAVSNSIVVGKALTCYNTEISDVFSSISDVHFKNRQIVYDVPGDGLCYGVDINNFVQYNREEHLWSILGRKHSNQIANSLKVQGLDLSKQDVFFGGIYDNMSWWRKPILCGAITGGTEIFNPLRYRSNAIEKYHKIFAKECADYCGRMGVDDLRPITQAGGDCITLMDRIATNREASDNARRACVQGCCVEAFDSDKCVELTNKKLK